MKIRFLVAIVAFVVGWVVIFAMVGAGMLFMMRKPIALAYQAKCKAGKVPACRAHARFLKIDCWMGDPAACETLGALLSDAKWGVGKDLPRALELFKKSCDEGYARGCSSYGHALEEGLGIAANPKAALEYYVKSCHGKDGRGCCSLGLLRSNGKVAGDPIGARRAFEVGCGEKNACCCMNLGHMTALGNGGPKDLPRSVASYAIACEKGIERACGNYGYMLWKGNGIKADPATAAAYLSSACDESDPVFCHHLALLYAQGAGEEVERDPEAALEYMVKACDGGVSSACADLFLLQGDDKALIAARAKAVPKVRPLCDKVDAPPPLVEACTKLGLQVWNGVGVARDVASARPLLAKGCDGSDGQSCFALSREETDRRKKRELSAKACKLGVGDACGKPSRRRK